jgi:penicillin-binding protein 1B
VVLLLLLLFGYVFDARVQQRFEAVTAERPACLYTRALSLTADSRLTLPRVVFELDLLGYVSARTATGPGSYALRPESLRLWPRTQGQGDCKPPITLSFTNEGSLSRLLDARGEPCQWQLEPFEFAAIRAREDRDQRVVPWSAIPARQLAAVLAIEDRNYYRHPGLDPFALLRALASNLEAGAVVQGGSTITQQLAKNLYTEGERSLWRKLMELLHVALLEWHYSKDRILETYLNEVYLGQSGARAVHGLGFAAQHYFGRPLDELELHQQALLAALVKGASALDPRKHPDKALARRQRVLEAMQDLGWITIDEATAAGTRPLDVLARPTVTGNRFPSVQGLLRARLRAAFSEQDLKTAGLKVRTSIDPWLQMRAELAVDSIDARAATPERGTPGLQAAAVVVDAESGALRAVVGGRNATTASFNRALNAVRPVGSLAKPFVYLAALKAGLPWHPGARILDSAPPVRGADGQPWRPRNYDGESHGEITLTEALAQSFNLATVRLGLAIGLPAVVRTLSESGSPPPQPVWPSLLLGALEQTPLQVARAYLQLSSQRPPAELTLIEAVRNVAGEQVWEEQSPPRALPDAGARFMLRMMLSQVVRRGTAQAVAATWPHLGPIAAKTGTTDGLRDSWFVGFGRDYLGVVWLGHDDNRSAGKTGATGALPIWIEIFRGQPPAPLDTRIPDGLRWVWLDAHTGEQVPSDCKDAMRLPLPVAVSPPSAACAP